MKKSQRFAEWLADELESRDMSMRELARTTQRQSDWGSHTMISFICAGDPPSFEAIAAISRAMQVDPKQFDEYRMAALRRGLNPAKVGYPAALRALRRLEQ